MIRGLLTKLKLRICPPMKGDTFIGDSFEFMAGNTVEQILHGLSNFHGDVLYSRPDGPDTYRMTIISTSMPYYKVNCEVLVKDNLTHKYVWKERSQPKRIMKDAFHDMIVSGRIRYGR